MRRIANPAELSGGINFERIMGRCRFSANGSERDKRRIANPAGLFGGINFDVNAGRANEMYGALQIPVLRILAAFIAPAP